jgi:hypothetical protein
VQCNDEAAAMIEAELSDGSVDAAACCPYHHKVFYEGWDRMQADAARLKASGFVDQHVGRIMIDRVNRGAYESEPAALELLVRDLEERFLTARIRFAAAKEPSMTAYIDLSFDARHFFIDCRNGRLSLAEFGGAGDLEKSECQETIVRRLVEATAP